MNYTKTFPITQHNLQGRPCYTYRKNPQFKSRGLINSMVSYNSVQIERGLKLRLKKGLKVSIWMGKLTHIQFETWAVFEEIRYILTTIFSPSVLTT